MSDTATRGWFLPMSEWLGVIAQLRQTVHPADLWQLPPDQPLTMAGVQEVHSFCSQTPVGASKLLILTGVDSWRPEVANALLKLLEEPPAYLQIALFSVTDRILVTIRSRVQFSASAYRNLDALDPWEQLWKLYQPINAQNAPVLQEIMYLRSLVHSGHNQAQITQVLLPH